MDTLKLTKPMMHGPAVVRLQELGDLLGFDRGPNDGIYGLDTRDAVRGIQQHLGLQEDGICGPITWRAIRRAVDAMAEGVERRALAERDSIVYDRRGLHGPPKLYKCERAVSTINTIVLHQTGCKMPLRPAGWDRLNAHIGITRDGLIVIVNHFRAWIWHAQKLSKNSIGVEIAGNFPGLVDNPRTLWKGGGGPHALTDKQRVGLHVIREFIQNEAGRLGFKIEHVMGHRQAHNSRIADPGEQIWKEVGLDLQARLNATDGGDDFHTGSGRPIPQEWDSRRLRGYWV